MPRRLNAEELDAYDLVPQALAERVRIVKVPFLAPGTGGLALGRLVLLTSDPDHGGNRKLIAHELVHVRQWHDLGVARFVVRYLRSYVAQLARHRNHGRAYRAIGLEVEAYDLADEWWSMRNLRENRRPPGDQLRGDGLTM